MVWQGNRIVGFLPMTVPDCGIPEPPLCVHYTGGLSYGAEKHVDLAMIEAGTAIPFHQIPDKEIRLGCMAVHHSLRGRNLSGRMIRHMADWAWERGWNRIRARVMLDGEPESFYPTHSFWMRLGFRIVGPVRSFGPSDDREARIGDAASHERRHPSEDCLTRGVSPRNSGENIPASIGQRLRYGT